MHPSWFHSTVVHMHPQARNGSGAHALDKLSPVPNQPKNKNKPIRVSEELWAEFGELCEEEGTNRAADLRGYMERRVQQRRRRSSRQAKESADE